MPSSKDYELPMTDTSKSTRFESSVIVGSDYAMPRAGKTSDYFTEADKKANPKVK